MLPRHGHPIGIPAFVLLISPALFADAEGAACFQLLAVVVGFVVILISIFKFANAAHERGRTEQWRKIAASRNLEFLPPEQDSIPTEVAHFRLLLLGFRQKIRNLVKGEVEGLAVRVFDFSQRLPSGKGSTTFYYSVFAVKHPKLDNLEFGLVQPRAREFFDLVLPGQYIEFSSHPAFSKNYLVKGLDESAIRGLFTKPVLDYFAKHPGLLVQVSGGWLFFYAFYWVSPKGMSQFLAMGFEILKTFSTG